MGWGEGQSAVVSVRLRWIGEGGICREWKCPTLALPLSLILPAPLCVPLSLESPGGFSSHGSAEALRSLLPVPAPPAPAVRSALCDLPSPRPWPPAGLVGRLTRRPFLERCPDDASLPPVSFRNQSISRVPPQCQASALAEDIERSLSICASEKRDLGGEEALAPSLLRHFDASLWLHGCGDARHQMDPGPL